LHAEYIQLTRYRYTANAPKIADLTHLMSLQWVTPANLCTICAPLKSTRPDGRIWCRKQTRFALATFCAERVKNEIWTKLVDGWMRKQQTRSADEISERYVEIPTTTSTTPCVVVKLYNAFKFPETFAYFNGESRLIWRIVTFDYCTLYSLT